MANRRTPASTHRLPDPPAPAVASADLQLSTLWQEYGAAIERDLDAGVHFTRSWRMNTAIKMGDLSPYAAHRARLDELLWGDDSKPKTIIDLGAGYGAMAGFWPEGSTVYNVDLPVMLRVQRDYVAGLDNGVNISFVPFTEADSIPLDGAYLFSVWALTETTPETWEYWIERAPRLAGAYVLGFQSWLNYEPWPWDRLALSFRDVRCHQPAEPNSWEMGAVNR